MRRITCSNSENVSLVFGETEFSPFLLVDADGVYTVSSDVSMAENQITDGAVYLGSVLKKRNIVLTLKGISNHVSDRNVLLKLFKPRAKGKLLFEEDENRREIEYYVESLKSTGKNSSRVYTISLLCPDPYFYNDEPMRIQMSQWVAGFHFVHAFPAKKEEFGYRSLTKMQNIHNENASDTGMEIIIQANGMVKNPRITHVETDQTIHVGTSAKTFQMVAGDAIRITTFVGDKHIYFVHENTEKEINEFLSEDSRFIQLQRGDNHIGYSAEVGIDNMVITITYRLRYEAA